MIAPSSAGVAIYTRISSDPDGTALGVARQEYDCRELCTRRGWEVAGVYQDNDVSAWREGTVRPAYQQMLKDAESGAIGGIVVYDTDRLTRQPIELEAIIALHARKGTKLATCSGDIDLGTHTGQMMARIIGAMARKSSDDTSRRSKRKKLELAAAGKYGGGGRAYGYAADRKTVVPAEAKVIREIVQRILAGDTLGGITHDLQRRGVPTASGGTNWRISTIKQIVTSGRIAGRRETNGVDITEAEWPPIITPAQSRQVVAALQSRNPSQRTVRKYSLTGLLYCERCGGRMRGSFRRGNREYACDNGDGAVGRCGRTTIRSEPLEAFIRDHALGQIIWDTDYGRIGAGVSNAPEVEAALEADQRKLARLVKLYSGTDDLSEADFEDARATLAAKIAKGRALLAVRTPENIALSDLAPRGADGRRLAHPGSQRAWELLEPARQNAILRLVYSKVIIGPGVSGRQKSSAASGRHPLQLGRVTTVSVTGSKLRHGQKHGLIPAPVDGEDYAGDRTTGDA